MYYYFVGLVVVKRLWTELSSESSSNIIDFKDWSQCCLSDYLRNEYIISNIHLEISIYQHLTHRSFPANNISR